MQRCDTNCSLSVRGYRLPQYDILTRHRIVKYDFPELEEVKIKSSSNVRLIRTLTIILQVYLATGNIRQGWSQGREEADGENDRIANGEPPIPLDCSIVNHRALHICQGCLQTHQCTDFKYSAVLQVALCPHCSLLNAADLEWEWQHGHELPILQRQIRAEVNRDSIREGRENSKQLRKQHTQLVREIMEQIQNRNSLPREFDSVPTYMDSYVDQTLRDRGKI
jgi:hypothetical protein